MRLKESKDTKPNPPDSLHIKDLVHWISLADYVNETVSIHSWGNITPYLSAL